MRSFGNFCVASVLGSSCTTCTLRSCAPYASINSSKYLCFERSLVVTERDTVGAPADFSSWQLSANLDHKKFMKRPLEYCCFFC
ncbi:MAG: hypothetical protein LBJ16_00900 [Holosporaceae bacterium]|nr:hypothetical protein [Holosporaceae bacterium]